MHFAAAAVLAAVSGTASADVITKPINFGQPGDQSASPVGTRRQRHRYRHDAARA